VSQGETLNRLGTRGKLGLASYFIVDNVVIQHYLYKVLFSKARSTLHMERTREKNSYISRVATVREKSGKNKNFSRSGKSQGILQKVRENLSSCQSQ